MKVSLIGSGNVATVLGKKIIIAEHEVVEVYSPNEKHAQELASVFHCGHTCSLKLVNQKSDLYIIAVTDQSLNQVAGDLTLHQKLVVHTAGSVSIQTLANTSKNYGVIYPLQSLRKELKELPEIPLLVDANTEDNQTLVYDFAKSIAEKVNFADDETRLKVHLAAVIVNNFSNHLFSLAENYCIAEKINFQLLLPLITETVNRLKYASPKQLQTGPAFRNDVGTIQKHYALLNHHPALQQIFEMFTKSIRETNVEM